MNKMHLTEVEGTLVAWHSVEDLQAVEVDGVLGLYVDGRRVPARADEFHASQLVINFCHLGKREQRKALAVWRARVGAR